MFNLYSYYNQTSLKRQEDFGLQNLLKNSVLLVETPNIDSLLSNLNKDKNLYLVIEDYPYCVYGLYNGDFDPFNIKKNLETAVISEVKNNKTSYYLFRA